MRSNITFILDGRIHPVTFEKGGPYAPTMTLLQYLRTLPGHKGTKEGCAEGDCGACTVVVGERTPGGTMNYRAVDSCLVFLPMLHGKQVITVESLKARDGGLHPVQNAMVESHASQCGFCTPGIVMSLFSLYKNIESPEREDIDDALTGNLCRCTGYKPIVEAAAAACVGTRDDHFSHRLADTLQTLKVIPPDSITIDTGTQQYFLPVTLWEALNIKLALPDGIVVSGATDVALAVTKRNELLKKIVDLSRIAELRRISDGPSGTIIGSAVSMEELLLLSKGRFPALHSMLSLFGSKQIRNIATIGGNLATASPIGDAIPVLMAYRAHVSLAAISGQREIPIDQFILGYRKTAMRRDEIITGIRIPPSFEGEVIRSYKVSKRKDLDISSVSAGFRIERENGVVAAITLAYGGMADMVKRATQTERSIVGKTWSRATVEDAMDSLSQDFQPISDARSGAEGRMIAARNLLLKFWTETNS